MDRATLSQQFPNPNELIHAILHGNITKGFPEPPSRVVKLFISSTRSDFEGERQHLHEVVVPRLEQYCNTLSLDLLVIDPHWQLQPNPSDALDSTTTTTSNSSGPPNKPDLVCNGRSATADTLQAEQGPKRGPATVTPIIYDYNSNCINPHEFELQLKEIEECSHQSVTTFFMCLIGHKYRPLALPTVIPSDDFQQIFSAAAESGLGDVNLLRSCYKENRNLQPAPQYVLLEPRRASRQYEEELEHIAKLVEYGSKVAAREGLLSDRFGTVMSAVHQQTLHALLCARQVAAGSANSPTSKFQVPGAQKFSPKKSPKLSGNPLLSSSSPLHNLNLNSNQTPTRRAKSTHRLMHQQSLQQGPTQKKIIMPQRQTSVTSNYALMQQPVDRMLCFIRQFEGVNFNNACISRFFDVTPTITTSGEDGQPPQLSNGSSLLPGGVSTVSHSDQQVSNKPLFAPSAQNDIQQLIEDVILGLKKGNVHYFNISWSPPESNSLQTRTYTLPEHYIERFGETVLRTLKSSVDIHLASCTQNGLWSPGLNFQYPAEIVREAHSHLSNFRRVMGALGMAQAIDSDFAHLLHVRELLVSKKVDELTGRGVRHQPIVVTGREGAGKSTLLAQVFTYAPEWLAENSDRDLVIRIVRQCGQSPSSNFASEMLRSLCLQIAIAYGLEAQLTRCSEAHELSELAICFQELLKMIESSPGASSSDLLIILDDLHHLQSAIQSSALLGWMPWHLPANVHFICSVALEAESVLGILRSRISSDNFVHLDEIAALNSSMNPFAKGQALFSMIQCKLRDEKRNLTATQWDFVRQKLKAACPKELENQKPGPEMLQSYQTSPTPQSPRVSPVPNESMTPLFANMLATSVLSNWESFFVPEYLPTNVDEIVSTILDDIEECIPYALVRRICAYLTCTKYGLRETELYNLVQETLLSQVWPALASSKLNSDSGTPDPYEYPRSTASTWLLLKTKMHHLLKEYYVQGKLYFNWRSPKVAKAVRDRYLIDIRQIRATHHELASAFYSTFTEAHQQQQIDTVRKESDFVREADELWFHLLYSGNKEQLKSYALLNIRFLRTIVQGVSVCYLRCILDAVRSQILDWDIEQLYGMLKQSVHVITQDGSQLPVEALLWLVPFVGSGTISLNQLVNGQYKTATNISNSSSYLDEFLRQAYRICVDHRKPLLYPINIWLNLPVPPQVTMITSPWTSITRAVATPDSQHLIICEGRMLHFYHLQTKTIVKSIEGHKSTITCLHLAPSGRWLATGSDDSSVNLWQVDVALMEVNECRLRYRFSHHTVGVLCVAINHAETLVLSGSEVGTICAVNLRNGTLISRLEHHRGMVTCMGVNAGDDVLVSGSTDRTVVVWSLDSFCILNEILLMRPVLHMDISLDSTFLLLSLDDNSLQVRALTTGTGVHTLQPASSSISGPTAVVSYVRFAEDNCRCVVGYADGRLLLFDIHSARQLQALNGHTEMITAILPQKDDHFLITCGGNKIVIWNFYPVKRVDQANLSDTMDKVIHESTLDSMVACGGMATSSQTVDTAASDSGTASTGSGMASGSSGGRSCRTSSDRRKQRPSGSFKKKCSIASIENHREPISCVAVSRDGQYVVSGGRDNLVKIWYTSTGETHTTLEEHSAPITCVDMAANSQFVVSGAEDGSIRTWSLTLSMRLSSFAEHQPHSIVCVKIMSDSKRVLSADITSVHRLWQVDTGVQLRTITNKPINGLTLHGNIAFAIGGKIENCLKYWSCFDNEPEKSVSHCDSITCFTCTHSGKTIITGSQDMSLKVWEAASAKLTQVLVGHEEAISCVATAPLNEILAVSGAQDCNLIVWDMATGADLFTLTGHNANVMGVILTPDGSRALSYSEDNTLQLWDIKESGQRLSILDVHHNFSKVYSSINMSYLAVWLGGNSNILPMIKHHNNPAHGITVELPSAGTPVTSGAAFSEEKSSAWLRGLVPRNATALAARTLKREQSFDSFYFEHMLHRGQSVDDFRKIGALSGATGGNSTGQGLAASGLSPFGSREQLWSAGGGIYDGGSSGGNLLNAPPTGGGSTRSRMISKLMNIGPKQKMLKKQQSMFACFPEFTSKQSNTTTVSTVVTVTGTESLVTSTTQANGSIGKKLVGKMFSATASATRPNAGPSSKAEEDSSGSESKTKVSQDGNVCANLSSALNIAVTDSSICSLM